MIGCKNILLWTLAICCLPALSVDAQTAAPKWHKQVYRLIDLAENQNSAIPAPIDIMSQAILSGKLTIYSPDDRYFTTKLTTKQAKETLAGKTDTFTVNDPTTNEDYQITVRHDFDPKNVHQYRVLEAWNFSPHSGKTEIQIIGIAPIMDVLGDNGFYRGSRALFWVRYLDLTDMLDKADKKYPVDIFAKFIWDDCFYSDVKPGVQK